MASKVELYQIYYKEEHRTELYDFALPLITTSLTPYFENAIINTFIPMFQGDIKVGICSWRLKAKRGDAFRLVDKTLTLEKLEASDADVIVLTPRSPSHKMLEMSSQWHGKAWDNAIADLRKFICIPKEVKHAIYENHFVTHLDLYKEYVNSALTPVMEYIRDREVYFVDSGYASVKSDAEKQVIKEKLGRNDWPIAPFILERLFSIWINDKNLKVSPL